MSRRRAEAWIAILLALALVAVSSVVLLVVFTINPVHADPAAVPSTAAAAPGDRYASAVDSARRLTRTLLVEDNLPGLSLAVAVDGTIVWAEGFGFANVERRTPVTPLTRFRIGSDSRPLTAAAIALLHERGRLDLDAPIQRYVPAYPEKSGPVTARQLMGDVAGVHRIRGDNNDLLPGRHCANMDEALAVFSGEPLLFRPGTSFRYSVYGWVLLSAAIEAVAREPFDAFMARDVFAPIGMENTLLDADAQLDPKSFYFPRMFTNPSLGLQGIGPADYTCYAGAGAFVSTPSDLVRFGSAMLEPGLLKAETLGLLQTPQRLESGASTGFALGWRVETAQIAGAPTRQVGHRATPVGTAVSLELFPDLGLAIAITTNVGLASSVAPLVLKVADVFARPAHQSP